MPEDLHTIEKEVGITKDQLNRESSLFKETIARIKEKYAGDIPR
ncbi:11766_t:CDS:1, partial [Acaulospora morrowiae]